MNIITDEKLKMCEEILKNKINDQSMDYEQNALRILEIAYAIGSDLGEDSINKIIDAYFDVVLNQQVRLSPESNSKAEEQLE
mgnify:CR=1 FL=1